MEIYREGGIGSVTSLTRSEKDLISTSSQQQNNRRFNNTEQRAFLVRWLYSYNNTTYNTPTASPVPSQFRVLAEQRIRRIRFRYFVLTPSELIVLSWSGKSVRIIVCLRMTQIWVLKSYLIQFNCWVVVSLIIVESYCCPMIHFEVVGDDDYLYCKLI